MGNNYIERNDNPIKPVDNADKFLGEHLSTSLRLDDEQRVKVLSPGMLVFKRFVETSLLLPVSLSSYLCFCFRLLAGF